ncbi:RHS repeat-associated core domain-containing protein [Pseudomonas viridiflava]|uniref:RHS repeat-associated core domain-containing protein n=1 Tax=Pseudomonas viridiflava TaxID=33069 RepID=UPI000F026124|nr:RHS repeat-associated core domain-containing protein [Pseudomonas viridiflava]
MLPTTRTTASGLYAYDAMDRLAACMPVDQESVRRFYQNDVLVSELRGLVGLTFLRSGHRLLAATEKDMREHRVHLLGTDQSNSVLHSVSLRQREAFAYSPYGTSTPKSPPYLPGYTGQAPDPITGHYQLGNGARAFNPILMRFNSPDTLSPFGDGGLSAYAYCKGDPVNYTDPTGHYSIPGMTGMATVRLKTVISPQARRPSMIAEEGFARTVARALSRNTTSPEPMPETRKYLHNRLKNLDKEAPFVQKLASVNLNLASHGDTDLSLPHAKYYADLAVQVHAGQLSNTAAHVEAALKWASMVRARGGSTTPLIGLAFNLLGALTSGTADQKPYITGEALLSQKNQSVRQVDSAHQ